MKYLFHLNAGNFTKKETLSDVFYCEFSEILKTWRTLILKNTFERLQVKMLSKLRPQLGRLFFCL